MENPMARILHTFWVFNVFRAFKILRQVYSAIDFFVDMVAGYSLFRGSRQAQRKARQKFEDSAHFMNILGRCNTSPSTLSTMDNFILKHSRYGNPMEILANDKISLWIVTPTEAVFTVCQADIYNTKEFPFLFLAQYLTASQVVVVSHATLHRLAQEVRDLEHKEIVLIHNTARCGSTLLCQMFSNLPKTRVISEPWSFMHSHRFRRHGQLSDDKFKALTVSMVKIHLSTNRPEIKIFVIKFSLWYSPLVPLIKSLFPSTKLLFITRHIKPSLESFERMLQLIPKSLPSEQGDFWSFYLPFPYDDSNYSQIEEKFIKMRRNLPNIHSLAVGYGGAMAVFLNNKMLYSHAVLYEDLVKAPKTKAKEMLDSLDIDNAMAVEALKGMESDSQSEMFTKASYAKRVNSESWAIVDSLLQEIGSPIASSMRVDQLRELTILHKSDFRQSFECKD